MRSKEYILVVRSTILPNGVRVVTLEDDAGLMASPKELNKKFTGKFRKRHSIMLIETDSS